MRGEIRHQEKLFSYVSIETRIPKSHPLRNIRTIVDAILVRLSPKFDEIYADVGRPSIPPEYLLKSLLLQVLFTIRSERQLLQHLDYNLLYRWFVGLSPDDKIWDDSTFAKNRERLLDGEIADLFFDEVVRHAERKRLVSREHFSVDGTLIEAWAGLKSFQKKESEKESREDDNDDQGTRNPEVDFKGEKRTNATHESKTDPDAKLYRKSSNQGAHLSYMGHVMMENRNGLAVDHRLTEANGTAERQAALEMAMGLPGENRKTMGGDKGYDERKFTGDLKSLNVSPHVAQNEHVKRTSSIDERTTRHPGYEVSQRIRKRIEEIFGWLKTIGLMRKTHFRGQRRVAWMFTFSLSVYNLVRITNLCAE